MQVHSLAVNNVNEFESGFREAVKARSGALAITGSALVANNRRKIISLAAKAGLPAIYNGAVDVVNGGLMSYGLDENERFIRAAAMLDKILKGAKPADIPVEQPMKFELVINFKTAKALGLTIPPIVLMRATRVIK